MEYGQASTSYKTPAPLFPAYSSNTHEQKEKKDWLHNSSFTESAFKEVCSQLSSIQNSKTHAEKINARNEIKNVEKKHGLHKKRKHKKYSEVSSFIIPESESILCQLKKKTFLEETGLSLERAFLIDSSCDVENLMFESFERTKIAHYYSHLKIPFGLSSEELHLFILSLPKKKDKSPVRYFSRNVIKTLKTTVSEKICAAKEPVKNASLSYIPVSSSTNCFTQSEKSNLVPNFLNISSSWKLEKYDNEKITDDKNSAESLFSEFRDQTMYFNKKLSEEPNNINLWIEFLDFQDKIFMLENVKKNLGYSEKNLNEKKVSILDKALKYNPKDVTINVLKLKLSQNLCNPDKLISMWENLIFFYPNNHQVWQEYLLYSISNLATFNVTNILKLYSKCLRTLSNISEGENDLHKPSADIIPNMLEIFCQLCYVLKSCGYTEKAIAAYQALIEFNLFCGPDTEKLLVNERTACFEPFWDSGAPRVGENNAIGWASTVKLKKISYDHVSTDSDFNNVEDEILNKRFSLSRTWIEFERLREIHCWLPWKPNPVYDQTSDDIDDPDRTVSFDDVSKFLFCVQNEENKFLLVILFLSFLGFDPHSLGCHCVESEMVPNPFNLENFEKLSYLLNQSHLIHPFANPFPSVKCHLSTEKCTFINNIFLHILDTFSLKYKILCTYKNIQFQKYKTLQLKDNKKEISDLKKTLKGILKKSENRNCLLLWFEYIDIEWLSDKLGAKKTFQTLLLSSTLAISVGSMQLQELWHFVQSFIELNLSAENFSRNILKSNEILWILIHVVNKEKYVTFSNQEIKPTLILKSASLFKSALEKELNLLDSVHNTLCYCLNPCEYSVISCAKCFAYFQYFSQGIEATVRVFEDVISFTKSKDTGRLGRYISEQICVAQAKIFNFHAWNSNISLKPLRLFLYDSVAKYPHNSQLLYLLVKLRSASSVISPTRRFLSQILRNRHKSHPLTWFFALIAEFIICRSLLLQNNVQGEPDEIISVLGINWRIRSLYEEMLQCDICAHISILWQSYMKFEVMTKNIEKAKSVFHRSLQNCGWSKELLMDALEYFPDELKEILAFMTEKQIRVHTPLEEVSLLMKHAITIS